MVTLTKRGHTYMLDGDEVPSVTTVLDLAYPKPALPSWAAKVVAQTAVDDWADLSALPPTERYEKLKGAPWVRRDAAALRGTDLHQLGERIVAGQTIEAEQPLLGMAQRYARWLDSWHVQPIAVERPVCSVEHRYAGTLDLIADLGGVRWLLDIKTGSGVYESHVLQLAGYRFCDHLLTAQYLVTMPPVDRVGVVHVTEDDCVLVPVDASRRAWHTFLHCLGTAPYAIAVRQAYKDRKPWPVGRAIRPQQEQEATA